MDVLTCGHVAYASRSRVCRHLLGPDGPADDVEYVRILTGRGMEYDMCCAECHGSDGEPELLQVCEGCADRADDEWENTLVGWRGRPEIAERPEPVDTALARTPLPVHLRDALDWAAVPCVDRSEWVFLTGRDRLFRFDAGTGRHELLGTARVPHDPTSTHDGVADWRRRRRLHVSPSGRYAAVVNDHGSRGTVLDLRTGRTTMTLDGGDYRAYTVPFALAFVRHDGREVMIHRTAWNRLDVSDPATGEPLTARSHPEPTVPGASPEHYIDYFHGALHVSPDGTWIADDGWVWNPTGIPTVWNLRRWLDDNPWESEDGPTFRRLCMRIYAWKVPLCWISPTLVAVFGIGPDEVALLDGVRIFDAETGTEVDSFPGPGRPLMADDRRLYSGGEHGLQIWDPFTGERTGSVPGFHPERHHPGAGELASVRDGELLRWATR
jgi:hypothetical protein